MKKKYLYALFISMLLIACGEASKDKQKSKKMFDIAVNTDEIKQLPEEQPLSQSAQEAQLEPNVPKIQRKIKTVTCDASSQTLQDTSVLPTTRLSTFSQEDDLESCSTVATEASPVIDDRPSEKTGGLQSFNASVQTLATSPLDNATQIANQKPFDAATQTTNTKLPEGFSILPQNDNQAIFTHALNQVQKRFQNAYKARESKSYNDFIDAVEDYKAAHNHLEALRKEFEMLGQNTLIFDEQLTSFCVEHSPIVFDKWQNELEKNLAKLSQKNERNEYPVLEKMANACIRNFEKTYEGEGFEYDALGDIAVLIERDNFSYGETSGIKSKIKAGDLDGVVRQLSPYLVGKINIILPESKGKCSGGAYSLSEINAILAAPEDTQSGAANVPGLAGRPYPYFQDGATLWSQGKKITQVDFEKLMMSLSEISKETIKEFLIKEPITRVFFRNVQPLLPLSAAQLSASVPHEFSASLPRTPRIDPKGSINFQECNMNDISEHSIKLNLPVFIHLKGNISSAKTTEVIAGSIAYRWGNTVIGAIQGYANSGNGFGQDGQQSESSIALSQNFGPFFIEGQLGIVMANQIHNCEWNGYRSQITMGVDTVYVIPFVQLSYRQLDRDDTHTLNETTGYVGLDMEIISLAADTYSLNMRLLTKLGYGQQNWSMHSKDVRATSGMKGSVEWNGRLNLKNGISFCTRLNLSTRSGAFAELKVSFDG